MFPTVLLFRNSFNFQTFGQRWSSFIIFVLKLAHIIPVHTIISDNLPLQVGLTPDSWH